MARRRPTLINFSSGGEQQAVDSKDATTITTPLATPVNTTVTAASLLQHGWKAFDKSIYASFGKCWDNCVMFEANGPTLYNPSAVHSTRLTALVKDLDDRDQLIQNGMMVDGSHFHIHQCHPPLWWGRVVAKEKDSTPKEGPQTGIALTRVSLDNVEILDLYVLILFTLPTTSAFAVNRLQAFKKMMESSVDRS
jgi:hypothetical protein